MARVRAQVVQLDRGLPLVKTPDGALVRCKHATALVKEGNVRAVVGDWVQVVLDDDADIAQIAEVESRTRAFVRKDPAERQLPQTLAANFDTVIVAHPLHELNVRRLERELVLAHETGAAVVVALTKADLAQDGRTEGDLALADDVRVLVVSSEDSESVEELRACVPEGTVAVLIGRSGVGKSSLVNLLAGRDVQQTTPVRETDGKGRHTTVNRAMITIERGGSVVDMPGVRGLGLWGADAGIAAAFPDVVELARGCRFRDCTHGEEPGCALAKAVEEGRLRPERLESYRHLAEENEAQKLKREEAARLATRGRKRRKRS